MTVAGTPPDGLSSRFVFDDEHNTLRESVRRMLNAHSSEADVRRMIESDSGFDPELWRQLVGMGLTALIVPARFGGEDCSYVELLVVLEEMGRMLQPGPYFSTVALATNALVLAGDQGAQEALLPGIAAGDTIATVAVAEASGEWSCRDLATVASSDGPGGHRLQGTKLFVPDGHLADLIIVAARTDAGPTLFAVDASAEGVERRRLETLDLTRGQAAIELHGAPGRLFGAEGGAEEVLEAVLDRARVALAIEQVGAMQAALDMAVKYAKEREQFGRPIGSFQAIKHKCASMMHRVESARSAAYGAAWSAATSAADLPVAASLAKAYCSEAFVHVASENIHVHGGIGFTWEHPAHLYFRRAKATEVLFGTPAAHRQLLADRLRI